MSAMANLFPGYRKQPFCLLLPAADRRMIPSFAARKRQRNNPVSAAVIRQVKRGNAIAQINCRYRVDNSEYVCILKP